jgi:hypothetical protein
MENNIIMLTEEQRQMLEDFSKKGVHSARLITRARVVLALDRSNKKDHLRVNRICEQEKVSRQAISDIRKAFLEANTIEEFLTRKKRETPPVQPKITGEVEAGIIATACSKAPEGYARWTVRLLADKVVELGFIDSISFKAVQLVLKKRSISLT